MASRLVGLFGHQAELQQPQQTQLPARRGIKPAGSGSLGFTRDLQGSVGDPRDAGVAVWAAAYVLGVRLVRLGDLKVPRTVLVGLYIGAIIARAINGRRMKKATDTLGRSLQDIGAYVGDRDRAAERRERYMVMLTAASVGVSVAAVAIAVFK